MGLLINFREAMFLDLTRYKDKETPCNMWTGADDLMLFSAPTAVQSGP